MYCRPIVILSARWRRCYLNTVLDEKALHWNFQNVRRMYYNYDTTLYTYLFWRIGSPLHRIEYLRNRCLAYNYTLCRFQWSWVANPKLLHETRIINDQCFLEEAATTYWLATSALQFVFGRFQYRIRWSYPQFPVREMNRKWTNQWTYPKA